MPSYKNQERNTWYCAFYFTDWQGKRKKKKKEGFKTKREAQEWERKFLEQYAGTPDISFDTLVKQYQKQAVLRLKPMTYYSKSGIIKNHLLPYFADMPINKISRRVINEWKNQLLSQYVMFVNIHILSCNPVRIVHRIQEKITDYISFSTFLVRTKARPVIRSCPLLLLICRLPAA